MRRGPGNITYGAQTHMFALYIARTATAAHWPTVITGMQPIFKNVAVIIEKQLIIMIFVGVLDPCYILLLMIS